ncbi:MAG: MFS transporter, partial [Actinobacteria bacterium]
MAEAPPPETVPRLARTRAMVRGLAVDLTPLRELVSTMGRQITVVALPFQVYLQTRSPLAVGLIGLVEVAPLIVSTIAGGAIADRRDRRTLILVTEFGLAATSALLLVGVLLGRPPLWYLYLVAGIAAAIFGVNTPSRSAAVPNLVSRDQLPAALALNQVLFNSSMIVG